jgi:hypothetical protein
MAVFELEIDTQPDQFKNNTPIDLITWKAECLPVLAEEVPSQSKAVGQMLLSMPVKATAFWDL